MAEKVDYMCPYCLRYNNVPDEQLEHNVVCYHCKEKYGVVNDPENGFGFTVGEFKDAPVINGEKIIL